MVTVNLVQGFVENYSDLDYTYSIYFNSSNELLEDELTNLAEYNLTTNTMTLTYRDEDFYNYVSANYIDYGWYNLQPISTELWDALFVGSGFTQSDIYYYQDPNNINFIQYNQPSTGILVWDGSSWVNDTSLYLLSTFKLLQSTITN